MSVNGSIARLQSPAPDFQEVALVNGDFKTISLDQYKGKYVVLFFYPMDFTFVCPTEIIAFSDRAKEFRVSLYENIIRKSFYYLLCIPL